MAELPDTVRYEAAASLPVAGLTALRTLRHGAPLPAVQRLLGHASIESTQIYVGVEVSDLRRMLEKSHPRERSKQ